MKEMILQPENDDALSSHSQTRVFYRDVNVTSKKVTVTVTRYFGKKSNRYSYSLHFQNE